MLQLMLQLLVLLLLVVVVLPTLENELPRLAANNKSTSDANGLVTTCALHAKKLWKRTTCNRASVTKPMELKDTGCSYVKVAMMMVYGVVVHARIEFVFVHASFLPATTVKKRIVKDQETPLLARCGTCDVAYCENCQEEDNITTCKFCKHPRPSCNACNTTGTSQNCEFCMECVCDNCLPPNSDPLDGRCCPDCHYGAGQDFLREQQLILRYGGDYERYF